MYNRPAVGVVRPLRVLGLVVVALACTVPWDNYLIERGVWDYGVVLIFDPGPTVPVEEFVFIGLQVVIVALWFTQFEAWSDRSLTLDWWVQGIGIVGPLMLGFVGWLMLSGTTFYLGAILVWAAPVLMVQWGAGWPYLWEHRRQLALGVIIPTLYFWGIDRIALSRGLWQLSSEYTTSYTIGGLPIEEAIFFFVTCLFVVQGLMLIDWGLTQSA